jgi:hypothetical protein
VLERLCEGLEQVLAADLDLVFARKDAIWSEDSSQRDDVSREALDSVFGCLLIPKASLPPEKRTKGLGNY